MKLAKTLVLLILAVCYAGPGPRGDCLAAVRTGLDNVGSYTHLFRGKRIGIITNHTGYDGDGRYIVDVFNKMSGVTVTALFSPEHGIRGDAEAGEKLEGETDPAGPLPVYSLYGKTLKPTPEMLKDVDILVFDIQDVGARFYTYTYTMSLAMEAAAENGKRFVVLDRPNPINGLAVEGNVLDPKYASFVGLYPIPVRHGMTIGEMAKMFNEQGWLANGVKADLVVATMKGWRRTMWYDQTGLAFIKPSPNMTSLETAVVYPGLCLLEGTNISEGRGTNKPFLQFGAPWIDAELLAARLNKLNLAGIQFQPISFTPTTSKYAGQKCYGAGITVTQRDVLEPYWTGILIVNEIHHTHPDDFQWRAGHFDNLCGSAAVRNAITARSSLEKLKEGWQAPLNSFLQIRKRYLLYPE
jgi:uncharacterized protein YbbC (DUF1343 family)